MQKAPSNFLSAGLLYIKEKKHVLVVCYQTFLKRGVCHFQGLSTQNLRFSSIYNI